MKWDEYEKLSGRTNSGSFHSDLVPVDVQHAIIGIVTEAGELMDAMKRALFYGKPLDLVNVKEELGDIEWYKALLCRALSINHGEVLERNIAKLAKRYPEKYSDTLALNRDLSAERVVLEGGA